MLLFIVEIAAIGYIVLGGFFSVVVIFGTPSPPLPGDVALVSSAWRFVGIYLWIALGVGVMSFVLLDKLPEAGGGPPKRRMLEEFAAFVLDLKKPPTLRRLKAFPVSDYGFDGTFYKCDGLFMLVCGDTLFGCLPSEIHWSSDTDVYSRHRGYTAYTRPAVLYSNHSVTTIQDNGYDEKRIYNFNVDFAGEYPMGLNTPSKSQLKEWQAFFS
jgi:hypothetical protein